MDKVTFVHLSTRNVCWFFRILVIRTWYTGWLSKAQDKLHHVMTFKSSSSQCCQPSEVLQSNINRYGSHVEAMFHTKTAQLYRLLKALLSWKSRKLVVIRFCKNKTKTYVSKMVTILQQIKTLQQMVTILQQIKTLQQIRPFLFSFRRVCCLVKNIKSISKL